jgi:glycosyltransferase involved in cell wall biosynthesis
MMQMENKVTVIMPTFNGRSRGYIEKALESVLAQTHIAHQIIVVDDGSSDDTQEFLRKKYPSLTVLHQPNAGPSAARNLAFRQASGEFICYLDDDDEWLPSKIERQLSFLAAHPEFGFTGCGMIYIDASSRDLDRELPTPWGCEYPESLLGNGFLPPSTLMFRKSLLDQVGDWNTSLRMGEDYELCFRCTKIAPIGLQMEYLTRYRRHDYQSCNDLSKIDDNTIRIIETLAAKYFPRRSAQILNYYRYGSACRALIRRDFKYFQTTLSHVKQSYPRKAWELGLRFLGVALSPFPVLKQRWRSLESRRLFAEKSEGRHS